VQVPDGEHLRSGVDGRRRQRTRGGRPQKRFEWVPAA
jgi:hypothetical protein